MFTKRKAISNTNEEAELLVRLRKGDRQAVREWFAAYRPRLLRIVRTKVSSEKDAEELVQDTFLSCLKHLPLFRGESSIWTWMLRVAHHEVADYFRRKYAKKMLRSLPFSEFLEDLLEDQALEESSELSREVTRKVRTVLKKMSTESGELLQMKYVDRKKVLQIARELGKSVKAVESLLFRARAEFRDLYTGEERG